MTAMNERKWYTVLEVEKEYNIPNATVRRYIRNHGHNLLLKKKGKSYIIAQDSIDVLKKIRELYGQGMGTEQIEEALRESNVPVTITVNDE
jgi:hypothetical protein